MTGEWMTVIFSRFLPSAIFSSCMPAAIQSPLVRPAFIRTAPSGRSATKLIFSSRNTLNCPALANQISPAASFPSTQEPTPESPDRAV